MLAKATGGTNRGGAYACWSGQSGWLQSASTAADVLGTGDLQLILGNEIYEDMYSGDYYFTNNAGQLVRGDVYMSYFQPKEPNEIATSLKAADMLDHTFGELNEKLLPGKSFNLRVTGTSETRNKYLIFPRTEKEYVYPPGPDHPPYTGPLDRDKSHRFVTDSMTRDGNRYKLKVHDVAGSNTVQIVNPYLAWLHASKFLKDNETVLASGGYLIWDGEDDNDFTAVKFLSDGELEISIPEMTNAAYIPPLQSFFVAKINSNVPVDDVKMSPDWTMAALAPAPSGYRLRAGELEYGVLRIRATQGSSVSHAALHFDKLVAVPEYRAGEDVRALFYDANPLAVYVLTPLREPLAISADGEYESHTTPLGLRIAESGEVTLTFTGQERGQERFGHDVFLIDREKNVEIDLQYQPSYTFTAVRPSVVTSALELNDRFVLRMVYTGLGNDPAPVAPSWTALPLNGEIHVRALTGVIRSLQVYNVAGALVYATQTAGDYFRIPAEHGQVYLIRANVNGAVETKKTKVSD